MKTFVLSEFGGIENLVLADRDRPVPEYGEVLVRVSAISVNPVDTIIRQNEAALQRMMRPAAGQKEFVIGWDISGSVVETGSGESAFRAGDEVFGMVNFPGQGKAYAEYVAAPSSHLALKPASVSHEEAAAATLAALTAWQALVTHARVKKGEKVLIHAAGGGVGHYAVQIAKDLGMHVVATASVSKRDFVMGLGADEFIDYASEKFEEKVSDADVVLDSIPGEHLVRSLHAAREGGRVISIKGYGDDRVRQLAAERKLYLDRILVQSNGEDMKRIAGMMDSGTLRSHVSARYDFVNLPEAHAQVETGRTQGKVVIVV